MDNFNGLFMNISIQVCTHLPKIRESPYISRRQADGLKQVIPWITNNKRYCKSIVDTPTPPGVCAHLVASSSAYYCYCTLSCSIY